MATRRIAVLGATGMIGSVVTRKLVEAGHVVTALVRDPEKAAARLPGIRLLRADVERPDSLVTGLSEAELVLFSLSVDPKRADPRVFDPERDGLGNVLAVLADTAPRRVLYVGSLLQEHNPHGWWVLDHKREALRRLEASGIPHTIFKPSNFMENLPYRNRRGRSVTLIGRPKHANWWISADDFGRQVARHATMLSPDEASSRTFVIQGPEAMTYEAAARRFVEAWPRERLKVGFAPAALMRLVGRFVPEVRYACEISRAINDSPEAFAAQETWNELGRPEITIEQYAAMLGRSDKSDAMVTIPHV